MSDMDMDMRIHNVKYTSGLESGPFTSEDVLSTNADPAHGYEASTTALGAHSTLFHALAAVEEDDDGENSNDVLLRLLNEVRAVESDGDDDEVEVIDKGSDENAAGVLALRHGEEPAKPYMPPYTAVPRGGAAMIAGGFTVEGNASYSSAASLPPPPPPPPPPPAYSTPSMAPRSPYANCYSGIPHLSTTPGSKPPPPSFAEAMATAHGTPASLLGRSVPSQECSPMLANYVPPMPAAPQETVLLRNSNGVFLLQPISKPTPPYTPPAGSTSPPVSPLPRYSLPPAAASTLNTAAVNGFLGSSMVQAGARASSITEPLHYAPFGPTGGSPYLSTSVPYSHDVGSVRGTPSLGTAPPPYACGAPRGPATR